MIKIIGDTHNLYSNIWKILLTNRPSRLYHVGDLGDPHYIKEALHNVPNTFKVVPGNHDSYIFMGEHSLGKRIYLPAFGYEEVEGVKVFWIKGATSIDKTDFEKKVNGKVYRYKARPSWDPREELTLEEQSKCLDLLDTIPKIDLMITHSAPTVLVPSLVKGDLIPSPTSDFLERVQQYYKPSHWVFGHFHKNFSCFYNSTQFLGLGINQDVGFEKPKGFVFN